MSSSKISIALAATALLVAVLFATPVGQAAGRLVLAKNSVGTAQLKKNAVTGLKVKNGTLLAADFKAGQLPAGPQGPKGDPGAQGPKGDSGAPGATKVIRRSAAGPPVGAGGYSNANVSCQPGESLVGGGIIEGFVPPGEPTVTASGPSSATTWHASFRNDGPGGSVTAFAYALCASP
jgi:hypothetical protein